MSERDKLIELTARVISEELFGGIYAMRETAKAVLAALEGAGVNLDLPVDPNARPPIKSP